MRSEGKEQMVLDNITVTTSFAMNWLPCGAIIVVRGENIGRIVRIQSDIEIFLGRDSNICDLHFHGRRISRKHCGIIYHAEEKMYSVIDYSSNGTFCADGTRISCKDRTKLAPGTELWLAAEKDAVRLG